MGRPVVLPACNLANELTDGENALLLRDGTALEIAARVEQLLDDPDLAERLGRGARSFALDRLSWPENAARLAGFYRARLSGARGAGMSAFPEDRLWELDELYRGQLRRRRDLLRHRPRLRRQPRQPRRAGPRELRHEGHAALLDGQGRPRERRARRAPDRDRSGRAAGRGPADPARLPGHGRRPLRRQRRAARSSSRSSAASHPEIEFIRERFPPSQGLPGPVAGIYSISVLEHIPADAIGAGRWAPPPRRSRPAAARSTRSTTCSRAGGPRSTWSGCESIVGRLGLSEERLHDVHPRARGDPDAYFVSAETHERWRGALPYDDYPMRRIASIGLLGRK